MTLIIAGLLLLSIATCIGLGSGASDPNDVAALRSLMSQLQNPPQTWGKSDDPCGTPWEGVMCSESRVTMLKLSTMGLKGTLSTDIAQITQLHSLDLSYNDLSGTLTPNIGNLKQLSVLILTGCKFSGNIPQELGNLSQLLFLDLSLNQFTGTIPASLGGLSNLYWLDLAKNKLTGSLPVSTRDTPGLDLLKVEQCNLQKNQLSGVIPESLFSSGMKLSRLHLNGNNFTGSIPASIGLVRSLEILYLGGNDLSGSLPFSINNLTNLNELNLANNKLTGPLPNLAQMSSLHTVDLSNNSFDASEAPSWFSTLQSLTTLKIESGGLYGQIPSQMFGLPAIQQVVLKNNAFNGTLSMGNNINQGLMVVDLQNNSISSLKLTASYKHTLILFGNPVCNAVRNSNADFCLEL
ncbi:putative leucine-rich repeat receptor-like protein kinase isoform X1 [Iris pallida]|uniref:Leucine-rich repeat receptor-like protein kinase isoform X1 n=1 Tax=Iris pallida TaxID=29817 RepID=A0AAX6ER99_IRIPA|nr:putative leucine-rich repeat receptor-like protein kinase isoform X1 [Iris pallida]